MNRTILYSIPSDEKASLPLTVKGFLRSKGYSVQNLKILKQDPNGILLDGAPAFVNAILKPGSTLAVCIRETVSSEHILPVSLPLEILYEDEDLLVVNKPAGMPTHPSQNNRDNTLANALAHYYQEKGQPFVFRCICRLDRDTSGLTIVAKHYVSAGILGDFVASKASVLDPARLPGTTTLPMTHAPKLLREYLAVVRGSVLPAQGTIDAPLGRKSGSIIERCVDFEHGERAVTHYRVLEEKNGYSLISLILETGRTHQIRIHLKYLGHPLVGDYLYNQEPETTPISRQALHSHRLRFCHPITGETMEFTAPLPQDMQTLLD